MGQGALVPRALRALEPRGLRHLPRGIGVLLAGPHGRGHAHDAPLRARQHGDRGVDDPRRALPHGAARHARGHLLPARRAARGWVRLVAGAAAAALSAVGEHGHPHELHPRAAERRATRGGHGARRALTADGMLTLAGLAVCGARVRRAHGGGAAWFARSEER